MATIEEVVQAAHEYAQHIMQKRLTEPVEPPTDQGLRIPLSFTVTSDLDRFVELYRSVGVALTITNPEPLFPDSDFVPPTHVVINMEETEHRLVLYFDEHGKFVGQGIWE